MTSGFASASAHSDSISPSASLGPTLSSAPRQISPTNSSSSATELSVGVQLIPQREQRRRLARLAWRVQDEVLPLADQEHQVVDIDPGEGRDMVVHLRTDRTGRVEEAHSGTCPIRRLTRQRLVQQGLK